MLSTMLPKFPSKTTASRESDLKATDAEQAAENDAAQEPAQPAQMSGPVAKAPHAAAKFSQRAAPKAPSAEPAAKEDKPDQLKSQATPSTAMAQGPDERLPLTKARINLAREFIKLWELDEAQRILEAAEKEGPPHRDVFRLLGESYFMQERWRESLAAWYRTSSMTKRNDAKIISQIRRKVMRCNAQLALEELGKGDRVAAAEHMAQAVEAVDYSTYLKVRRDMVDPIVAYARDILETRNAAPRHVPDAPLNIILCLDVIKISAVHSHKHLYLSLAASLASLDPNITVTLVATYERQISWNAGFEDYYRPDNIAVLRNFIDEKVPEDLRDRISVRYFESFGVRGLINTCEQILNMQPDMILYGGGRTGYHANESLLVRHILHKYVPTGFFFVQSNNDVDELTDVIIARGPHPLNGDPQDALVRYSPYPPFPGLQAAVVPDSMKTMPQDRKRILTAWVGVRLDKTLHGYQDGEVDQILDLLGQLPEADWHLVGAEDPKNLLKDHKRFQEFRKRGRIIVHPVLNYDEFYHMASSAALFFQPPGFTGGGGGASIARNNSVPILCFEHSDVAPLQPEEFVFAEDLLGDGIEAALKILKSDTARDVLVQQQWALLEARRSEAPQKFYNTMIEGVARYKERRAQA
ncbi:hypothetical protein [uncultured Pelagimonas sp.]|uniref:tetratricopeptide repeat protein n=1 Tax=uncultured Pelagimonas sp. TaxID=1618102 RepID=UPI00262C21AB|nr:hypothetical protein [uncultured Pelagimonas sp.]